MVKLYKGNKKTFVELYKVRYSIKDEYKIKVGNGDFRHSEDF